jgi:hypothetical protein
METMKEITAAAMETMEKVEAALQLDLLLLEMEEKQDMMDGLKMEVYL